MLHDPVARGWTHTRTPRKHPPTCSAMASPPTGSMLNCSRGDGVPWASSSPCSGRGRCVPGGAAWPTGLCVCDAGFSAASDMFDLRVAVDPITGEQLSLDCPLTTTGSDAVWWIVFVVFAGRAILGAGFLLSLCWKRGVPLHASGGSSRTSRSIAIAVWNNLPYRLLILEVVAVCPLLMVVPLLKTLRGETIGTDAAVTVLFLFGFWTFLLQGSMFVFTHFSIVARTRALNQDSDDFRRLVGTFRRSIIMSHTIYGAFAIVPTLVALGTDKSLGPIASGEYICLLVRNIGVILYALNQIYGSFLMDREARQLLALLAERTASTGSADAATAILAYVDGFVSRVRLTTVLVVLVYGSFLVPWAWPYQTYSYGLLIALAGLDGSFGKVLIQMRRAGAAAGKSQNSTILVSHGSP